MVAAHDRDGVAGAEPEAILERGGERLGLPVQVVEAERAELVDHRRAPGYSAAAAAATAAGRRAEAREREQSAGDAVRAHRPHDARRPCSAAVSGDD